MYILTGTVSVALNALTCIFISWIGRDHPPWRGKEPSICQTLGRQGH